MGIDFQSDIVDPLYAEVITDTAYQSPGLYGLPDSYGAVGLSNFSMDDPGAGYAIDDSISVEGGTGAEAAALTVTEIAGPFVLTDAQVEDAGTGYAEGNVLSIVGGTSDTVATITVDTVGEGGAVDGYSISDSGSYTSIPEGVVTVTGGGGSGFTANLFWGGAVVAFTVADPGSYNTIPDNPVVTTSSGGGIGFTGSATWSSSAEQRILMLIAVLESYLADMTTVHEAKLAGNVIQIFSANMSYGSSINAASMAERGEIAALKFIAAGNFPRLS